ncbi:MAG: preprotein translocase subunit SecE [Patescibacteria group bacterium]
MSKFIAFLKDVRVELAKVTWPTRQETVRYTLIVIGSSIAVAIFLGACDLLFQYLLKTFVLK